MSAAGQQNGVLQVLTFTGTQPFVVRCERDTRVKDIVGAIAEIWGFKEAARLFTLCRPASGSEADPSQLLPGTLLSWTDRPCQASAAVAGSDSSQDAAASATPGPQTPPLLLVRYIFGTTASDWDQNHSVLSLTAAQIAADVAAGRYPAVPEAGLYQHWVKQGQHSVVLHMASSWPSGACLIVGPAQVLSGGAALQLGNTPINLGLNGKGIHIMLPDQHKLVLPLDSISSATPAGDVLNITFASSQPDLLLQLPGAEAVAEAFKVHKDATGTQNSKQQQPASSVSSVAGSGPASGKRAAPPMQPLWITSPSVERWLQEPTPKDDTQLLSAAIQVLRPWEQTPPALRVLLTTEAPKPDPRLVEAQLLVVEDDEPEADGVLSTGSSEAAAEAGSSTAAVDDQQPKQRQQRVKLQLKVLQPPAVPPEPRVKLTIAPVPQAEQELLMPAQGEEPLVRLVLKPLGERAAASTSPLNMLRLLHKGAATGAGQQGTAGSAQAGSSADGIMLRGSMLGALGGGGGQHGDERPAPQLMQRLQQQQQQQQEVRQGLLAGPHLGGSMGQGGFGQSAGMRPAYGTRPSYNAGGYRQGGMIGTGTMQHQGPSWSQQQYGGGMMARPAGMRPLGATSVPHQPYTLVGPPNNMMGQQQGMSHRPGMGSTPMGASMQQMQPMQARMRPQQQQQQQQHYTSQLQYQQQQQQQQQQQYAMMRQPQQQAVLQQGGYMVVQQQQPSQQLQQQHMMQQQQQPQIAYAVPQQQQQQPAQQVMMMQTAGNTAPAASGNMVLVTTADGRQLLVHESQLQQQQQQQVMPGVFVLGPHGELVPTSQPAAADPNAGMQQMVLQQQQPLMVAQPQGQPMFVQPTPSQKLQQQFHTQQQMQGYAQPQQQRQVANVGGLATGYDQMQLMGMTQPQLLQAQPMGFMDLNANQMQLQGQQQQQQQFIAVSSAQAGVQATQLLQLQGISGTSTAMGVGQQGLFLQGHQQQQQPMQQQVLLTNAGGQQQVMLQSGATLLDGSSMGLLQQQQQQQQVPRHSSGATVAMTSAAMFGGPGTAAPGLVNPSGPGSTGGSISGLGLLQQGMAAPAAPGLQGIAGSTAPGLQGMNLGDGSLNNTAMGIGGVAGLGGVGGISGLAGSGASYLNNFDPLRQPNSHSSLDNTGLGMAAAGPTTADPPGLTYGNTAQKQTGFLHQQQPQQQQAQMFTLGNAGMAGLAVQDGLQGGLQGGVLSSDGYMLTSDGMGLAEGAPGLDATGFGTSQQLTTQTFY